MLIWIAAAILGCWTNELNYEFGGPKECRTSLQCPPGQLCVDERCRRNACFSSTDCVLGRYCSGDHLCVEGCKENSDCQSGYECDAGSRTCEPYGCRTTLLDCEYGEFCDTGSSECYEDDYGHCGACTQQDYSLDIQQLYSDGQVQGEGHCLSGPDDVYYDLKLCDLGAEPGEGECPRGFSCGNHYYLGWPEGATNCQEGQCPPGRGCYNGRCLQQCTDWDGCGADEYCYSGFCFALLGVPVCKGNCPLYYELGYFQ
jgi:hypothetical protein